MLFPRSVSAVADHTGKFTAELWCSAEGKTPTIWRSTFPTGEVFRFVLDPGTTPVTLSSLRAVGQAVTSSRTMLFASLGEQGLQGEAGPQGEPGPAGSGGSSEPQHGWTADGDRFWIAPENITVESAEERGTGVLTYGKVTGSQTSFAAASLPVPLLNGEVLRIRATGVSGWKAVLLRLGAYAPEAQAPTPEVVTFSYPTAAASRYAPIKDALTRRVRAQLKAFTDWLDTNGRPKGYVGEVGWPNTDDNWHALAEAWYAAADAAKLHVTNWSVGDWWKDYPLPR
jgi:hypothetical protein